ncbi:helicase [Adoxophyes orana nucleopolyhedrovirus]|uniref:helicase n=1 Tax=Adoxophyes orana nucleopolyhedrovirus TaxID=542343 RepID=UPI0001829C14|nr:helicase [Adoxophyes orana nucleopolyhedrovirus]ACF05361.1 helicase [Adoxophyes orana nucleopolyhedrovirus]
MAAINVNDIFEKIFKQNLDTSTNNVTTNLDTVDNLLLKNSLTEEEKVVESNKNFEKLILVMSNHQTQNGLLQRRDSRMATLKGVTDDISIEQHEWTVQGNYFIITVKPHIHKKYYSLVSKDINFSKFVESTDKDYPNYCVKSRNYYYWPNVDISYFGWRQYLFMKYNIDIGNYVPLVHHKSLGNVNLFVFRPKFFLNVEMSMCVDEDKLFVNGRSKFNQNDKDLFVVTTANGKNGTCKVKPVLVYSNKKLFDVLREDINLRQCTVTEEFKDIIKINLQNLRNYKDVQINLEDIKKKDTRVTYHITPSCEQSEHIENCIDECINIINETMMSVLNKHEVDDNILAEYFVKSNFVNFVYLIILLWRMVVKNDSVAVNVTNIRFLLETVCEKLFYGVNLEKSKKICQDYYEVNCTVFNRFCNQWTIFANEDARVSLANFFAIHYKIYFYCKKKDAESNRCWNFTYENAMMCGAPNEVLCSGYFKKIVTPTGAVVFNGKHYYTLMRKDDELNKLTESVNSCAMSSIKFNNWKYMYFTEEGVFNVLTNTYHDSCPFILGNSLLGAIIKRNEKLYLSRTIIDYMENCSSIEKDIYKIYHMAKVCRDIKMLKCNISILLAFGKSFIVSEEKIEINKLFREIWNYEGHEVIPMLLYLNNVKMKDLVSNLLCKDCHQCNNNNCDARTKTTIDLRILKLVLMFELFSRSSYIVELIWSLLYNNSIYYKNFICMVATNKKEKSFYKYKKYAEYFFQNKYKIIDFLTDKFKYTNCITDLIDEISNPYEFLKQIEDYVECNDDHAADDDDDDNNNIGNKMSEVSVNFWHEYCQSNYYITHYNIWWDKLLIAKPDDTLNEWCSRFYSRVILNKFDLKNYPTLFVQKIVAAYINFKVMTGFNAVNSRVLSYFAASLAIPSDYDKFCIYLNGTPGSGKSTFYELLETFLVVHKHDSDQYKLIKDQTNDIEVDKLISQLYVINEMKVCNDSFFKTNSDSTKSNSVCRKYHGSQKYEGNYKMMIINNKPLHIIDYDKGVRNRFGIIYTDHKFEEDLLFSGSVYSHIKEKKYPQVRSIFEGQALGTRLYLSHILKYKRNCDGYVLYKSLLIDDEMYKHNLLCLDVNNSVIRALIYVMKIKFDIRAKCMYLTKVNALITEAAPIVETMIHEMLKGKGANAFLKKIDWLQVEFRNKFHKCYNEQEKFYFNLSMATDLADFNHVKPQFKC